MSSINTRTSKKLGKSTNPIQDVEEDQEQLLEQQCGVPDQEEPANEDNTVPSLIELFKFMKSMKTEILQSIDKQGRSIKDLSQKCETLTNEVYKVKTIQNDQEQRQRNYSIRIFNFPVTDAQKKNNPALIKHIYSSLLQPILLSCKDEIDTIPAPLDLIEMAHPLKSSKNAPENSHPPIILRFFSRTFRLLVLKNKKKILDSMNLAKSKSSRIFVTEDLTKMNYSRLMELSKDETVDRCYSLNGQIKYILKGDPEKKLHSATATFE